MGVPSRRARVGAILAVIGIVVAACTDEAEPDDGSTDTAPPPGEPEPVAATELVTGDCLVGIVIGRAERIQVESASTVGCSSQHDLEVFTTFELTPDLVRSEDMALYPGRGRVISAAEVGCNDALADIGIDTDLLGAMAFWPSSASWADGDREVACAIYLQSGNKFDGRQLRLQPEEDGEDGDDGS